MAKPTLTEEQFLEMFLQMHVKHGYQLESMINAAQNDARIKMREEMDARMQDAKADALAAEKIRRQKIVEYYACMLNHMHFPISESDILTIEDENHPEQIAALGNWDDNIRTIYGLGANPFTPFDTIEKQLFLIGIADMSWGFNEKGSLVMRVNDLVKDVPQSKLLELYKPLEEVSGVFETDIPKIRQQLELYKVAMGNVE